MMRKFDKNSLDIRRKIVEINSIRKAAHLGSCLSCVEILLASFEFLKPKFENLIFSKGHAALAYYVTYEFFSKKINSKNYLKIKSNYWAHITKNVPKKINFSFGSLGYGLGIAAGTALAKKKCKIICVLSDGELNEGSIWESLFFISHHKLNNLNILIDENKIQSFGKTKSILNIKYRDIFKQMRFNFYEIDGHSTHKILKILNKKTQYPKIIMCQTIKAKGLKKYENRVSSHYYPAKEGDVRLVY